MREPDHVLFAGLRVCFRRIFGEAVERHEAAALRLRPRPPIGKGDFVGGGMPPAYGRQLGAGVCITDDRAG
jgi:hypothetical protein